MTDQKPVYLGQFDPIKAGDKQDFYIDITADLVTGEAIDSVAFTVTDDEDAVVPGVVTSSTETAMRTDFRVEAPAIGVYVLTAAFTIDDGQLITKTAHLRVV